ncbi:MAG: tRNA (N6-isopentenyl adenosine(37)-C2)-methylthiotransferase MiaB [Bacillota bacterium]
MQKTVTVPEEEIKRQYDLCLKARQLLGGRSQFFHIESYGCQMNDHDSEKLSGMLLAMGYQRAKDKQLADLIVFNTCCVRAHAEQRVFGNIGALKKRKDENPSLIICVCGCMMQQKKIGQKLYDRFPFVDLVFGTHNLYQFPELLLGVLGGRRRCALVESSGEVAEGLPVQRGGEFSTNLTITYGCDNFCSYCIVPYVRGRERSRTADNIEQEARALVAKGYREITLLGQNVNSYRAPDSDEDFPALLERLNGIEGRWWLRFMTSHPKDLSPRLIGAMATLDKVCNHIHLPVQSGSNAMLDLMNRRYSREDYFRLIDDIRAAVKDVEITTDIIVGFPGETEKDFEDTLDLVERVGFAAAYTFMYSPRPGTKAASMQDQIAAQVKKERLLRLNELQTEQTRRNNLKFIGRVETVLVEGVDRRGADIAFGKTSNFKMVYFPGEDDIIGQFMQVRIESAQNNSLIGSIVKENGGSK